MSQRTVAQSRTVIEPRLLLSGDVTVGLGDLLAGQGVTIQFEAMIDVALPKALDEVFNQVTVRTDNLPDVVSDPVSHRSIGPRR
jgi:hypothetical protein